MRKLNTDLCPVCGYNLGFKAWDGESASDEICPCCGIQFGYTDFAGGELEKRKELYLSYRAEWIKNGMKWQSVGIDPPTSWNPINQLKKIGARV